MTAQERPRARSLRLAGASSTVKMTNRPPSRAFRPFSVQGLLSGLPGRKLSAAGSLRQTLPPASLAAFRRRPIPLQDRAQRHSVPGAGRPYGDLPDDCPRSSRAGVQQQEHLGEPGSPARLWSTYWMTVSFRPRAAAESAAACSNSVRSGTRRR